MWSVLGLSIALVLSQVVIMQERRWRKRREQELMQRLDKAIEVAQGLEREVNRLRGVQGLGLSSSVRWSDSIRPSSAGEP